MFGKEGERHHQSYKKTKTKKPLEYKNMVVGNARCHFDVSGKRREETSLMRSWSRCHRKKKLTGKQAKLVQSSASRLPASALLEL